MLHPVFPSGQLMSESELTPQRLRRVFGTYATGVTVISSAHNGALHGMTVNSFTSVSLSPPMVLYCSTLGATYECVVAHRHFVVNILSAEQLELARVFAGQTGVADSERFGGVQYSLNQAGCPVLDGCLAHLECKVKQVIRAGDHEIILAEVEAIREAEGPPLLFFRGKFPELPSAT